MSCESCIHVIISNKSNIMTVYYIHYLSNFLLSCRPENCPDALYGVMVECFEHDGDKRPTFTEILIGFEKPRSDTEISVAI